MTWQQPLLPQEFKKELWQNKENRYSLLLSFIAALIAFVIFKRLYPYPNFLPDSYSYMDAAFNNVHINMWPVGYSKFLRLVSVFNRSDTALILVQYFLLQTSIWFFLLTIRYLIQPGKWVMRVSFAFLVLNPLWLYISNFVSSDALFAACSLLWLTSLFWILQEPRLKMIVLHALVLGYVFSVRYNALYYPLISLVVILAVHGRIGLKLKLMALIVIPAAYFTLYTVYQYNKSFGTAQFSPFGGWQMATNALFAYAHVPPNAKERVPRAFKKIHGITVKHMDSLSRVKVRPDQELGIYYLWDEKAPLKVYLAQKYAKDSTTHYLKRWASVAPLYGQYGSWLIRQHPGAFAKHYVLPNLVNYYAPPVEFLGIDNMGKDSVDQGALLWFGYKTNKVHSFSKNRNIILTGIFPPFLAVINILFFFSFVGFSVLGGFGKISPYAKKALLIVLLIWCVNLVFSVLASPIVLRYQAFPFIITFVAGVLLLAYVIRASKSEAVEDKNVYTPTEEADGILSDPG